MSAIFLMLCLITPLDQAGDSLDDVSESPTTLSSGVELWVNKDDAVYYQGDRLKVFFKTGRDCYVAVYDLEVGGEKSRLFPSDKGDGWVEAGKVYELPAASAEYDYEINGPEGIETIVLLASKDRLPESGSDHNEDLSIIKKSVEIYVKEPEPARLRIISTPKKCRIYIEDASTGDEEYIGRAPRTLVLKPGEYLVKIKKLGYQTLTRRIRLEPNEHRRVFVKLWED